VWWGLLLCTSSLSYVAQLLMTMALQRVEAGPINVCSTLEMVFSFIFQVTLLSTRVDPQSVIGAVIIFAASVLVGLHRIHQHRRDTSRHRAPSLAALDLSTSSSTGTGKSQPLPPAPADASDDADGEPPIEDARGAGDIESAAKPVPMFAVAELDPSEPQASPK